MHRLVIVGGAVLAGAVVPSMALAGQVADTVTAPTATYTQGQTPTWNPSYSLSPLPATPASCTAGNPGFTPTRTTPPGVYGTVCSGAIDPGYTFLYNPGTLTVLPALSVTRVPALVVGGGSLPLGVTVMSPVTITVKVTRGAASASVSEHVPAGRTLVSTPLLDHGHRLVRGTYQVAVTASTNGVSTTANLSVAIATGSPSTAVSIAPLSRGRLGAAHPLDFRFSQPVAGIAAYRPIITPAAPGHWTTLSPYESVFTPTGFGFPLGGTETFTERYAVWTGTTRHTRSIAVQSGSLLRAEQLLAQLAYLPLKFTTRTPISRTAPAQAQAATAPPGGTFTWRYRNTPAALRSLWTRGRGVMIQGAIKAFENDHRLSSDGVMGPGVWRALERAAISGHGNHFGYSFVHIYRPLPQHLVVWHNGRVVYTALVNTGIPGRPTNFGVFPIFVREASGTMSGTNPNGSTYHDPGIRWISYFSGGDALHAFSRPGYGYPQSLGCVEMTDSSAYRVWQLTEMGTLVDTLS